MKIIPLSDQYLETLKVCTDKNIGQGYYDMDQLKDILSRSQRQGLNASFLLVNDQNEVLGFRLTYPPGNWLNLKAPGKANPQLWGCQSDEAGYFQSLFLAESIRGGGWGRKLSEASLAALKQMGAKAVVCHSWKESPHSSSMRYLEKMGFQALVEIPNYWFEVDYECTRCGKPCLCTATEMVFYL